jgi:glycosyltransferase involved in cell wall biosynthesis
MRIGLSARWLNLAPGGAREYTEQLIRGLTAYDQQNEYVVFHSSPKFLGQFPCAEEILIRSPDRWLWEYAGLPFYASRQHLDLFWTPSYVIPFPVKCRSVASVLDLAYYFMPRAYRRAEVLYMRCMLPSSVKRASAILAISEHTKRDLVRLFPNAEPKVFVTHLAPSPVFRRITDEAALMSARAEYGLDRPFIFYAGSISPRKGLSFLAQAFADLRKQHGMPHRLVLTGARSWGDPDTRSVLERIPRQDILILGQVPASSLPAIYSLADLFVFPSLYEGFGLPVLEAMACGCPVVCSNLTSLPEVAGDAALMVDPRDVQALVGAMAVALTDARTRERLIEKGRARAASFTWEEVVRKTAAVFSASGSGSFPTRS